MLHLQVTKDRNLPQTRVENQTLAQLQAEENQTLARLQAEENQILAQPQAEENQILVRQVEEYLNLQP